MTRGTNPVWSTHTNCDSVRVFPSQNVVLTGYRFAPPPCVYAGKERSHVKDPVVHVRVRWITEPRKHCTGKNNWVAPYYGCTLSPGGKHPEFPVHCIGTRKLSHLRFGNHREHALNSALSIIVNDEGSAIFQSLSFRQLMVLSSGFNFTVTLFWLLICLRIELSGTFCKARTFSTTRGTDGS